MEGQDKLIKIFLIIRQLFERSYSNKLYNENEESLLKKTKGDDDKLEEEN